MQLSLAIGSMAVVLGVAAAGGYAVGEDSAQPPAPKQAAVQKPEAREAQRRAALEEYQKRRDAFERACNKPLKSDAEFDLCRAAYQRLNAGS